MFFWRNRQQIRKIKAGIRKIEKAIPAREINIYSPGTGLGGWPKP